MEKQIMTKDQVETLKNIGVCMLATSSNEGVPHCTIVEPSRIEKNQIIIPVVQMMISKQNIKENSNIFIHFYKINEEDSELNVQYKISANAKIEDSGELFEDIKKYEEKEVLPEGFFVNAIIIADLLKIEECIG